MATLKPGDQVLIIAYPGAVYPHYALPGTRAVVVGSCGACPAALRQPHPMWAVKNSERPFCAVEPVLQKIDPDWKEPGNWEECPYKPPVVVTP